MSCCKYASRVDAEHVLDDNDKFLHILQVSLLGIAGVSGCDAVIRVGLPTCRNANALHVDGNSEWIRVWVVKPGLLFDSLGFCIVAMERKNDR